jgi:hypothetical protein
MADFVMTNLPFLATSVPQMGYSSSHAGVLKDHGDDAETHEPLAGLQAFRKRLEAEGLGRCRARQRVGLEDDALTATRLHERLAVPMALHRRPAGERRHVGVGCEQEHRHRRTLEPDGLHHTVGADPQVRHFATLCPTRPLALHEPPFDDCW